MNVLMLCHDRQIDRRIIAQAKTLLAHGHHVRLFALNEGSEDAQEILEGIEVHRIHLAKILAPKSHVNRFSIYHSLLKSGIAILLRYPRLKRLAQKFYKQWAKLNYLLQPKTCKKPRQLVNLLYPFKQVFMQEVIAYSYDLIQVHDLPLLETGVELAQKMNVPLVYDAHELYPEQLMFHGIVQSALSAHEAALIKKCAQVFTVNESIALEMHKRYAISKPTVLLNALDGLDASKMALEKPDIFRTYFSIPTDVKVVLLQGMLIKYRQIERLVQAFACIQNPKIALVIMGDGELKPKLLKIARRYDLWNKKVYFFPKVPQTQLLQHTSAADLGIIPYPALDLNTQFCTPNKLFEFIQAGLPIIANDLPELRRYVQDTGFGMVHPMRNSRDIAQAIDLAVQELETGTWQKKIQRDAHLYTWKQQSEIYWQAMQPFLTPLASKDSYEYCN